MKRSAPLLDSNPTLFWKLACGLLSLAYPGWLIVFTW
jgi:hypothetical protein